MAPSSFPTGLAWLCAIVLLLALGAGLAFAVIAQPLAASRPSQAPPVDTERLKAHVRRLSVDIHPRSYDHADNLDLAALYIRNGFAAAGAAVSLQEYSTGEAKYKNVVARFGPEQGPLIVVGAHYDTHDGTPGADDNASGVAGLLELARLLGQHPPARPVELVAYPLEEPPYFRTQYMGSARHAEALKQSGREVRLMLSLEMIGYFTDAPASQSYPSPGLSLIYPSRGNFIALVGRMGEGALLRRAKALMAGASALPVRSINAPPHLPGIDLSDHLNYWNRGMPALMVTDTAFLRNPNYHQAGDTWDTLDYARMGMVVQAVYALVQEF